MNVAFATPAAVTLAWNAGVLTVTFAFIELETLAEASRDVVRALALVIVVAVLILVTIADVVRGFDVVARIAAVVAFVPVEMMTGVVRALLEVAVATVSGLEVATN